MVRRVIRLFLPAVPLLLLALTACQDIGLKAAIQKLVTLRHRIAWASDLDNGGSVTDVYVMEPDGTNVRRITEDALGSYPVAWSPDGRYLAISCSVGLRLWDAETGILTDIPDTAFYTFLSWSPDGSCMLVKDSGGNKQLRNRFGSGLLPLPYAYMHETFCWSRATGRLVFPDNLGGASDWEVFTMNPNGSDVRNLTNNDVNDAGSPMFSPDGSRIAFTSERVPPGLFVMDADGSNVRKISDTNGPLSWSPAGDWILWFDGAYYHTASVSRDQQFQISTSQYIYIIFWSPDGTKLIYSDSRYGNGEIYSVYPNGAYETNLTENPEPDTLRGFSPDGKKILYEVEIGGFGDIFTMDLDGGNKHNLTNSDAAYDTAPVW